MKKIMIILFYLITSLQLGGGKALAFDNRNVMLPKDNEVYIAKVGMVMPLGNILLVRKNSEYCAVKFTKFWLEKTSEVSTPFVAAGSDKYALYESYYQGDGSGDFSKKNAQFKKEKLSFPKPRGIGRLAFSFSKKEIICDAIKLEWFGKGGAYFYGEGQKEGDYGIELAPTKWTDISQVNVFDQRLKWYRYDENRKDLNIPVDKLWE